jgi:hypothetical protein
LSAPPIAASNWASAPDPVYLVDGTVIVACAAGAVAASAQPNAATDTASPLIAL